MPLETSAFPDDLNDYGYFYVLRYGTVFGLPANIVEENILLMEFVILLSLSWMLFYLAAIIHFGTHMCWGWQKVVPVPALEVLQPRNAHGLHP